MTDWDWRELESRFMASPVSRSKRLLSLFTDYLRYHHDDLDARKWFQDLLVEFENRAKLDPHYHPTSDDGIHRGAICAGAEIASKTPFQFNFAVPGADANVIHHGLACGPTGAGKTNWLALLVQQACAFLTCIVFARNPSFRRLLTPAARAVFRVVRLEETPLNPIEPCHLREDAAPEVVERETRQAIAIFCNAWARRYSRHDSMLLMRRCWEALLRQQRAIETLPHSFPTFPQLLDFIEGKGCRKVLGRSPHEDSLLLTLKAWELSGQGVFNSPRGIPLDQLFGSHLLVELDGFADVADAAMVVDYLLGMLWLAQSHRGEQHTKARTLLVFDDLQGLLQRDTWLEAVIRLSRHKNLATLASVQSPAVVSPEILSNISMFCFTGSMTSRADLDVAHSALAISVKDPMAAELQTGRHGKALIRLPGGVYPYCTMLRIPRVPQASYDENERLLRLAEQAETHPLWLRANQMPAMPPRENVQGGSNAREPDEEERNLRAMTEAFVRSANEHWTMPMEFHFAKCGAREGSVKAAIIDHAKDLGWIQLPKDGLVMNANARRQQLVMITEFCNKALNIEPAEDRKKCRGKLSTRYYQATIASAVRKLPNVASVELEGVYAWQSGSKQVDVLARYDDGGVATIEFASAVNADWEIHNARLLDCLDEQPSPLRVHLVVAETRPVAQRLRRLLRHPFIRVTTYAEFVNDPAMFLNPQGDDNGEREPKRPAANETLLSDAAASSNDASLGRGVSVSALTGGAAIEAATKRDEFLKAAVKKGANVQSHVVNLHFDTMSFSAPKFWDAMDKFVMGLVLGTVVGCLVFFAVFLMTNSRRPPF